MSNPLRDAFEEGFNVSQSVEYQYSVGDGDLEMEWTNSDASKVQMPDWRDSPTCEGYWIGIRDGILMGYGEFSAEELTRKTFSKDLSWFGPIPGRVE